MELSLHHSGRYTHAQSSSQVTHGFFLALIVSGVEYSRTYDPAGKLYCERKNSSLSLSPPGFKIEFSFSSKRENFVLVCDIPGLEFHPDEEYLLLKQQGRVIRLHRAIDLSKEKLLALRINFERIIELRRSPLPGNIFMAEQLTSAIIAELALHEVPDMEKESLSGTLAGLLKKCLDDDEKFQYTLQEHCRILGYSPEHARRCFFGKYNIEPQEYRLRRKVARLMLLLGEHNMSTKEIADELGMKNVSHLHAFVRQRCGMTLRQLSCKLPR